MKHGSLFTGAGGLDMAVEQFFGARTVWRSDIKPAACKLIEHYWPGTNIGDLTAVDWAQLEPVDVISGGSPCQDMSQAGKRAGMKAGTRSGLWSYMQEAIETIRPRYVVWENVRGAYSAAADSNMEPCPWCVGDGSDVSLRACGRVLGDLAELGYDAQWCGLRAADAGAPHGRSRVFILATDSRREHGERRQDAEPGSIGSWYTPGELERSPAATPDTRSEERGIGAGLRTDGPARVGWSRSGDGTVAAADTADQRPGRLGSRRHAAEVSADAGDQGSVAHAAGNGRNQRRAEPTGIVRGSDAAERGAPTPADTQRIRGERRRGGRDVASSAGTGEGDCEQWQRHGHASDDRGAVDWGQYEPAIRRWEHILGRPAPHPTITGPKGGQQLSPDLTDWMMGWPEGWTDVPDIKRAERLSLGGDGVVPQQAVEALHRLWPYASERAA